MDLAAAVTIKIIANIPLSQMWGKLEYFWCKMEASAAFNLRVRL
jgi:hypothetical protein